MKLVPDELLFEKLYEALRRINVFLDQDVKDALRAAREREEGLGKKVLNAILENIDTAERTGLPLCQDTGMIVTFVEIGESVNIQGSSLRNVIDRSIEKAYRDGHFRLSTVADPFVDRRNTGSNLPAVVYTETVDRDVLKISFLAKGFGSENCSRTFMLKPTDGEEEIIRGVCETVEQAGGNPCPPVIVGIGLGGTMDWAAVLSKRALLRPISDRHPDERYAHLEDAILHRINQLGIGPSGLGGETTALGIKVETYGTHIAGLPLAVSLNCWADRKAIVEMLL